MWLSAIFPSLHHGPKTPKTSVTTTQACGSPLCSMLSHPNRPGSALCGVMSWGNFHYQSSLWTCEMCTSWDIDEQLTIINGHCPLQPTVIQWRSRWVCMLLHLQEQKWLIKRSSFHNQKIWCDTQKWGCLNLPSSWTAWTVISLQWFGPLEMSCYTLLKTHHCGLQSHPLENQKHIQWICKSTYISQSMANISNEKKTCVWFVFKISTAEFRAFKVTEHDFHNWSL